MRIAVQGDDSRALRGRARGSRRADRGPDRQAVTLLAHGIGGVRDLPVPRVVLLHDGGDRPRRLVRPARAALAAAAARGARRRAAAASRSLSAVLLSRALRVAAPGASRSRLLGAHARDRALRDDDRAPQLRADVRLRRSSGSGSRSSRCSSGTSGASLSPWRAIADAAVWVLERGGREARPVLEWTGRWGRYPAAGALFSFVALELANPRPGVPADARRSRSRSTRTGRSQGWRCTAAMRGRGTARGSPSRSGCSRESRRSPFATGRSSCAGRSPGSAATSACRGHARVRRRDARLDELRRVQRGRARGRT